MIKVSPKWIQQVLRQRGIPLLDEKVMERAISVMDDSQRSDLLESVRSLESGTESEGTLERVREQLRDVTAKSDRADHQPELNAQESPVRRKRVEEVSDAKEAVRRKHHIYGKKAALTIELDQVRRSGDRGEQPYTLMIEAAQSCGERKYDWQSKVPFQLMKRELPLLAAKLLGFVDHPLTLANHGPESNKTLKVDDQGSKLFVIVSMGPRTIGVPVEASDVHAWLELVMEAMSLNSPIDSTMQLHLLRRVGAMLNSKDSREGRPD